MQPKMFIPLVLALGLGSVSAYMVYHAIQKQHHGQDTGPLASVVVAGRDIAPGETIHPSDMIVTQIPVAAAPLTPFNNTGALDGRIAAGPMFKGQTVLENNLAPLGSTGGLSALITKGMRAITIEVNEFTAVGGMVLPGSKVDIIAVLHDDRHNQTVSRTVLQDVVVMAVGHNVTTPSDPVAAGTPAQPPTTPPSISTNNVTLLVTPEQAQVLQLAAMSGRPWLVLRNGKDNAAVKIAEVTLSNVMGYAPDAPTSVATASSSVTTLTSLTSLANTLFHGRARPHRARRRRPRSIPHSRDLVP